MWAAADRRLRLDRAEAARGVVGRLDDEALGGLLRDFANGWGRTVRVAVERHLLFVKAVPLTDDEVRAGVTTANLYDIPSYLNYPFGSPGLGAGRELAFARRSTGWVESGACSGFRSWCTTGSCRVRQSVAKNPPPDTARTAAKAPG